MWIVICETCQSTDIKSIDYDYYCFCNNCNEKRAIDFYKQDLELCEPL
jgi:hypothetical protein